VIAEDSFPRRCPVATLVVATKNRRDGLRRTLQSATTQRGELEVIVIDDGSNDGTSSMVAQEFPSVRLVRHEQSAGYIQRRNEGAGLATAPYIFSLDDDATYSHPDTIEQTVAEFTADPRIAAIAMPCINVQPENRFRQPYPSDGQTYITNTFIGTAYAVRRDAFLAMGGFRTELIHQGEESDFCIRLLDRRLFVRLGAAPPILHDESPQRNVFRWDAYGRRNNLLFAWQNAPLGMLFPHLAMSLLNGVRHALRTRRFRSNFVGLAMGLAAIAKHFRCRSPVSHATYRQFRQLAANGYARLPAAQANASNTPHAKDATCPS
jgi:GT2 family glycosyltransferase